MHKQIHALFKLGKGHFVLFHREDWITALLAVYYVIIFLVNLILLFLLPMSQSIPTGCVPPGKSPGGRDLTFESCPRAGNSTRAGILWKMILKLQKIAWIKFLQVKTKKKNKQNKQVELLTFFEVYVFCQSNFSWSIGQFFHTYLTKIWRVAPGLFIWSFCWFMVIHTHFLHKKSWLCSTFCPCIGFISDKYRVSQKISKKWGTLRCWFPIQSMLNAT